MIKLNDGQFKAIRDSLAKWQYLAYHDEPDYEPECVCCKYDETRKGTCGSCPINKYTSMNVCFGTPYGSWGEASNGGYIPNTIEAKDAAEAEYLFLEGIYSIELHRRLGY